MKPTNQDNEAVIPRNIRNKLVDNVSRRGRTVYMACMVLSAVVFLVLRNILLGSLSFQDAATTTIFLQKNEEQSLEVENHDESSGSLIIRNSSLFSSVSETSKSPQAKRFTPKNATITTTTTKKLNETKKVIMTKTSPHLFGVCNLNHCPRNATHWPNRILAFSHAAGLSDRVAAIRRITNVAGFLCAKVVLPPPREWLSRTHNHNQFLSKKFTWNDFVSVTFFSRYHDNDNNNRDSIIRNDHNNDGHDKSISSSLVSLLEHKKYIIRLRKEGRDTVLIPSKNEGAVSKDLMDLAHMVARQTRGETNDVFVWDLRHLNTYIVLEKMAATFDKQRDNLQRLFGHEDNSIPTIISTKTKLRGCEYKKVTPSPAIVKLAFLVLKQAFFLDQENTKQWMPKEQQQHTSGPTTATTTFFRKGQLPFGFFHIRRTDASRECNTEPSRVQQHLTCVLNQTETTLKLVSTKLGHSYVIFFASDESDTFYRNQVLEMLSKFGGIRAVDLDKVILETLQQQVQSKYLAPHWINNYIIFAIGLVIESWGRGPTIRMDRSQCPPDTDTDSPASSYSFCEKANNAVKSILESWITT